MAGKSIEEILRQQAAQRQAQISQQQAQERAIYEQREIARQEYLKRNRMYERFSPTSAASAAAGAGGSVRRSIPTINGHAELILFSTTDLDNWQYVIMDFLAETISTVKDTGVIKTSSFGVGVVENTGFIIEFDDNILFINDNAEIIETLDNTNFMTSRNRRSQYYALFNDGTIKAFDGKVVTTYTGIPVGSDSTQVYLTKNSLVIATIDSNLDQDVNVYVWNPTIGVSSVLWSGVNREGAGLPNRLNGITSNDKTEFFSVAEYDDDEDGWKTIHMFGDDGTSKTDLDVTSFASNLSSALNNGPAFLSNDTLEFSVNRSAATANPNYYFNIYDYNTDTWRKSTHARGVTYSITAGNFYQNIYDGAQYTSLSNGSFHLLYSAGSTSSQYNIDKYNYIDVVWSLDGSTFSSYTVNNAGTSTKGIDVNDADRDGPNGLSLYLGESIFLPMWLNDSTFRLLCLTSTQSVNIAVGSTTGLTGTQGENLIPGWNVNQRYASFRVGDNFGVWLAYASADVYKVYNKFGANVISLTMSVNTRLNYSGNVAVVTDSTAGIEYVFTPDVNGVATYATYSYFAMSYYGLKPEYVDGDKTPSKLLSYNEGAFELGRMYTDEDVFEFTIEETTDYIYDKWLSDEYVILLGNGTNLNLYFYDWTATLLATVDTGIPTSASYEANLVKDRLYFKVDDTLYYFSPTKSDSIVINNISAYSTYYDYFNWWID